MRGEVAGGELLGGAEDAGAPLLVAALGPLAVDEHHQGNQILQWLRKDVLVHY